MSHSSKRHFHDIDIKELIHQYKQYDCLWDINSPYYKSKLSKQRAWLEIANYFQKEVNEVKRKVQYLRTAYVHEKRRVDASKKSGSKPHKPLLFYYKELDFLDNMVIWRKFGTKPKHAEISFESDQIAEDAEELEFISLENQEEDYLKEPEINYKTEPTTEPELKISILPQVPLSNRSKISHSQCSVSRPVKKKVKAKINHTAPMPTNDLNTHFSVDSQTANLYISFGKTIALQLELLPMEIAILTMSEIHTILTETTLEHLRSLQKSYAPSYTDSEDNYRELIEESYNDSS